MYVHVCLSVYMFVWYIGLRRPEFDFDILQYIPLSFSKLFLRQGLFTEPKPF